MAIDLCGTYGTSPSNVLYITTLERECGQIIPKAGSVSVSHKHDFFYQSIILVEGNLNLVYMVA